MNHFAARGRYAVDYEIIILEERADDATG